MARFQPENRKITANDLYHGTMLFKPDNAYEAAKFQQIAFAMDIEWQNKKNAYVTEYELTKKGIAIEGAKLSVGNRISTPHIFGLADLDETLYRKTKMLSIDDIHLNTRWFMPRTASEAVGLLDLLQNIKCEWPENNSGAAKMAKILETGIVVNEGTIRSGYGYARDQKTVYNFNEISAVPLAPESTYIAKIFNQLAASEKIISEQAELIKKQSALLEKIYEEIKVNKGFGFDKGMK